VLFADDTSIVIANAKSTDYEFSTSVIFKNINDWFNENLLTLNFEKTHFIEFLTRNRHPIDIHIDYGSDQIVNLTKTKFLGLIIDNSLSWNGHVDWLMSRLGSACFAIRAVKPYMSIEILRTIYFAYFHSIMSYGLIFWGNSSHSSHIFKLQKRAIRIMTNSGYRASCRELFKEMEILPLKSQFIFSLLMFVVNNKDQFESNFEISGRNTRSNNKLHFPSCNVSVFQKGVHYLGIKVFNGLPTNIRKLAYDIKHFKIVLKRFLLSNSFYSLDEYFDYKSDSNQCN
jgi:hypothetical protein